MIQHTARWICHAVIADYQILQHNWTLLERLASLTSSGFNFAIITFISYVCTAIVKANTPETLFEDTHKTKNKTYKTYYGDHWPYSVEEISYFQISKESRFIFMTIVELLHLFVCEVAYQLSPLNSFSKAAQFSNQA